MPKLTNEQLDKLLPFRKDEPAEPADPIMEPRVFGLPAGSRELLDEYKTAKGIESDYRAADWLGVDRSTVSKWRQGKGGMSDEVALKVAAQIGYDPAYVLIRLQLERTQSIGAQAVLSKIIRRLERHNKVTIRIAAIVAACVLSLIGVFSPQNTAYSAGRSSAAIGPECALCETSYTTLAGGCDVGCWRDPSLRTQD